MSERNEELVRQAHAAMNRFDAEALVALCEPDVTFESRITALETTTYRGHDGVREFIARLAASFEWIDVRAEQVLGDGDRFVVANSFRARGASSGAEVEQRFVQAVSTRDGRAVAWTFHDTLDSALAAARGSRDARASSPARTWRPRSSSPATTAA